MLALTLMVALLVVCASPASALVSLPMQQLAVYTDNEDTYKILDDRLGNIIVEKYTFNLLMERAIIDKDDPSIIDKEKFTGRSSSPISSTIVLSDYAIIGGGEPYTPEGDRILGNITYYGYKDGTYQYYGIQCSYHKTFDSTTTFTINASTRNAIDFFAIVIAMMINSFIVITGIPTFGSSSVICGLIAVLVEVTVPRLLEDWVNETFFPTLACHATEYAMTISDRTNMSNYRVLTGGEYSIEDQKSEHYGEIYIEGYVPAQWGTPTIANDFHNRLFPSVSIYSIYNWW